VNLFTPSRDTPHRGCTSSNGLGNLTCNSLGRPIQGPYSLRIYEVAGTCWAMAHIHAISSRAIATTT
jgi:hypothetical protein